MIRNIDVQPTAAWDGVSALIPAVISIICDDVSDLPNTVTFVSGYTAVIGSTAHVVSNQLDYEMLSNGTWVVKQTADVQSLVTSISNLENEMTGVHGDIDILINQVGELHAAAVQLIDSGAKNVLRMTGTNVTGYGVSCVFDNINGTITLDGVNSDKKCTGNFNVQVADPNNLNLVPDKTYHFLCDGTSDTTYGIYVYKAGASPNSQFDCYTNNELPWNSAWNTSNGFRLFIRSGTVVDNVVLRPMITPLDFWKISENFVPYSPSNAELYQLIRGYHP